MTPANIQTAMIAAGEATLPATAETVDPKQSLPSWRTPWRQIQVWESFLKPLEPTGRWLALRGFTGAESAHRAIIREIERAREVVTYGLEGIQSGTAEDARIAEEAIANSRGLIERQRRRAPEVRKLVEPSLVEATASVPDRPGLAKQRRILQIVRVIAPGAQRSPVILTRILPRSAGSISMRTARRLAWASSVGTKSSPSVAGR